MSVSKAGRMHVALGELIKRIKDGEEFPDAVWRASQNWKLRSEELKRAYDAHCLEVSERGKYDRRAAA